MNTTKKWYQSKTIWAILVGLILLGMKAVGVTEPQLPASDDVSQAVDYINQVKAAHGSVASLVTVGLGVISLIGGIIARIKADTKIG